jgi:predicted permease
MLTVLAALVPIFALIALGYGLGRVADIGPTGISALNAFTARLALPALLFQVMADGGLHKLNQPGFTLAMGLGIAFTFIAGLFLIPVPHRGGKALADRALAALTASYSNTAFIGIPLLQTLMGATGLAAAALDSILVIGVLFAVAVLLVEIGLNAGGGIGRSLRKVALALLRNPIILAPILGALLDLTGMPLPIAIDRSVVMLAAAASPCALVTIGAFLRLPSAKADPRALGWTIVLKMVFQPLVTAAALLWLLPLVGLRLDRPWVAAGILLAALPTGTGPFMLAELYEREVTLASRAILLSSLISAITLFLLALALL